MRPYEDITDPRLAKALAHPIRTRVLAALDGRTASPSDLASELDVSLGVLSYHVRRLTALGFLKLVKRVPRRGAVEHYYTATARPRITNTAWGAMPGIVKDATVSAALDQIGSAVEQAAADHGFDAANARLTRTPVTVDAQGWDALADELRALSERVREIESESQSRARTLALAQRDGDGDGRAVGGGAQQATVVLMLFHSGSADGAEHDGAIAAAASERHPAARA